METNIEEIKARLEKYQKEFETSEITTSLALLVIADILVDTNAHLENIATSMAE